MVDFEDMSYETLKKAVERKFDVELPDNKDKGKIETLDINMEVLEWDEESNIDMNRYKKIGETKEYKYYLWSDGEIDSMPLIKRVTK